MMRRKDREVTDTGGLNSIINKCEIVRIAMIDDGIPYIVPLNFGFKQDDITTFYFHSALEEKKIDALKKNPKVCFELDCSFKITKNEIACKWGAEYESIVGYGEIQFIDNIEEKIEAMDLIMSKYGHKGKPEYLQDVFAKTVLYKLTVSEMLGKRNVKKSI